VRGWDQRGYPAGGQDRVWVARRPDGCQV
jgi:hypothetical protein